MSEVILPQSSLFLGIIPALILLYISLKGYEGHYKEKNIFLTFVVGIIAGFLSVVIEALTISIGVLFIVLFPLVEQFFKTIILNMHRFQQKKETVIYGLSLGLGFGSIFTPFSMITSNFQVEDSLFLISLVVLGSFSIILLHGATGIYIGYGVYTSKLPKYLLLAILLHLPITGLIFLTTVYNIEYLQIGLVIYSLIIYWFATTRTMPQILPRSNRRKRDN